MKSRRDALIRDIALLFTRYSISDWQQAAELLRLGGADVLRIAESLEIISSRQSSLRKKKSSPVSKSKMTPAPADRTKNNGVVEKISDDIRKSPAAKSLSKLRNIYVLTGGKSEVPPTRDALINVIAVHISELPESQLSSALDLLRDKESSLSSDYDKWVKMIYGSKN